MAAEVTDWSALVDSYVEWLRNGINVDLIGDVAEITTPFMDRHNDHLQIYARRSGDSIILSDEGETISDLVSSGIDVRKGKRRAAVDAIARGLGVRNAGGVLSVEAAEKTLGQRTHSLIQSMLAVNDLHVLARSRVASVFWEDVREFLDENSVRYIERVKVAGKSGFDHAIDFFVPSSKTQPERMVQALANPTKAAVSNLLFAVNDARALRADDAQAYAILNDEAKSVPGASVVDALEALAAYEIRGVKWSERLQVAAELAA